MPPADDIQRYLGGVWQVMTGRPDGMRRLDLSADGFWNSFFAIVVALPALAIGWVSVLHEFVPADAGAGAAVAVALRLAVIDLGSWIVPLAVLAAVSGPLGIGDRFVPYVVASNWASVILVWITLPPALLRLAFPATEGFAALLSLGLFALSMVLLWRLTVIAIDRGTGVAAGVYFGMLGLSLAVLFALQGLFGLTPVPA
ncbi:transporter [Aquibium sp. A9E412]|uniref:transporter n=1 Tax=Aquibium sp. A9E412 TaxID=2976767 RepID=UPI0025B1A6D0|nr:transporter [Aquibium sp. A9E412]MDN2566269.1 transporter [Aquibium sp. A9E412]